MSDRSATNIDSVLNDSIELIISVAKPDLVLLFVREGEDLLLLASGPAPMSGRYGDAKIHRIGECLCGSAALEGKPVYSSNIGCDHRCTWDECKKAGFSSFAALPLISKGEVIGVLGLAAISPRDFSEQSATLSLLAQTLSITLNARLVFEKQRSLEAAVQSERYFSDAALDSLPGVFYQLSAKGSFLRWNRKFEIVTGYSAGEIASMSPLDLFGGDDRELVRTRIEAVFTDGYADVEAEFAAKNGVHIPYLFTGKRVELDGEPCLIGMGIDITGRKKAEDALRESELTFRALFEKGPIGVAYHRMVYDDSGKPVDYFFLDANQSYRELTGVNPVGKLVTEAFPGIENDTFDWIGIFGEVAKTGKEIRFQQYLQANDRWYDCVGYQYKPDHFVAAFLEITEGKRAEKALHASERRFKELIRNSTDTIVILDKDGLQIFVSDVVEKILGFKPSELVNIRVIEEMIHPDDQERTRAAFETIVREGQGGAQYRHKHKNGSWIYLEAWGTNQLENPDICGVVVNVRDITERKHAEEERENMQKQLLHAQKLESLGVLAGGIAHDFNNLLMAIMGNADLALMRLNPESPAIGNLHKIEQASARAADLAKQMLAYSGKGKFVVESLDMNRLLEEMLHMLEVSISKKAVLRLNQYQPLPQVEADATQMRQIIMNLVINASEAIGDRSGVIAITTGCMDCDHSYLKDVWLDENLTDGLYVYLEIADTGCGMDKETLTKLFDPFFTTKFTGRGLGMAAVLGITRGHKGAIKVYSEPGKGTSFKLLLPASDRPAELFNGDNLSDSLKGSGTVLLVDDEETVRGIGVEMLKELGFDVITANDGREAVEIFKSTPAISFVILDLTMPHMDGEQCFRELRKMKADVKVIMSSGFSEDEVTQKFVGKGLAGFIQKPYKLSVLKEAIRRI